MIKILAIGNSFSQDATAWLEGINPDLFVRNLYIASCSLEMHRNNIRTDEKAYSYEENAEACLTEKVSIKQALLTEDWDYITVQQVSHLSGEKDSYYPYLSELLSYVKKWSKAKLLLHKTWAYEKGSEHPQFYRYHNDSEEMYQAIKETAAYISQKENLAVIDTGDFIHRLRKDPFFDIEKGGVSLYRDKFHLSFGLGRLAAALVWSKFFGGKLPPFLQREDLGQGLAIIKREFENL